MRRSKACRSRNSADVGLFPSATVAKDAPIIPISAQLKYNIDAVNEYICTKIPVPNHNFDTDPRLIVIRSFDVNKPGATVDELKGGVAGGSILSGVFKVGLTLEYLAQQVLSLLLAQVGQEVEIRPGKVFNDASGKFTCQPLRTRIVSLFAEGNDLKFAVPGGLIGVGTLVDPILCKGDKLLGNVMTAVGKGADIYIELEISCEWDIGVTVRDIPLNSMRSVFLLRRLLGVKTMDKKLAKVGRVIFLSH